MSADDGGGGWTAEARRPLRPYADWWSVANQPGGFNGPTRPEGIGPELLPLLLQTPQMTVLFAQLPYASRITGRREFRAVSACVGGPRGSNVKLVGLMQRALVKAHWRTHVDWGSSCSPRTTTRATRWGSWEGKKKT